MPPRISPWMLAAVVCCAAIGSTAGCNRADIEQKAIDQAHRYAELPGLQATTHQGLKEELARLIDERATPKLLDAAWNEADADAYRLTTIAVEDGEALADRASDRAASTAVDWDNFYPPRSLEEMARRIDELYPIGALEFHAAVMRTAIETRTQYEPPRQRLRRLLATGYPRTWTHSQGLLAEAADAAVLRIGARLEGLAVAEALSDDRPDAALACVRQMFAAAQRLAREPRVVSRIVAVQIREDALQALAAVCSHPRVGDDLLFAARTIIDVQLANWPHDRLAWQGDRAAGLHTYELVRDGQLMLLLTGAEKVRFKRLGVYEDLEQFVAGNIDGDEMYYLSAMRRLIAICDKPHYQRVELLEAVRRELLDLHATAQYPVVADTILLADFEQGFRLQALDRARVEAWQLALRAATSPLPPEPAVNPLTGEPFAASVDNDRVTIDIDPESGETLVLPIRR